MIKHSSENTPEHITYPAVVATIIHAITMIQHPYNALINYNILTLLVTVLLQICFELWKRKKNSAESEPPSQI